MCTIKRVIVTPAVYPRSVVELPAGKMEISVSLLTRRLADMPNMLPVCLGTN